jgi:hypothetical protein
MAVVEEIPLYLPRYILTYIDPEDFKDFRGFRFPSSRDQDAPKLPKGLGDPKVPGAGGPGGFPGGR